MSLLWTPKPHQLKAVQFALEHGAAGLFLDPGLGKTSIMLSVFKVLREAERSKTMLVVAPKRVCQLAWPGELRKWENFNGIQSYFIHGDNKRYKIPRRDVYFINPEGLEWYFASGAHKAIKPDILVVDESTKFRNTQTERFKKIKHSLSTFRRRYILTGTPTPKGVINLFGQIYLLDGGATLGKFITHYRTQYFTPSGFMGHKWKPQPGAFEAILDKIAPFCLRMEASDWINMPKLTVNPIVVQLPPDARRIYNELERYLITLVDGDVLESINGATVGMKLRQIANGGVWMNPDETRHLHDAKLDALEQLVDELAGSPLLVAYEFIPDALSIMERFKKRGNELRIEWLKSGTSERVAVALNSAFNEGAIDILLVHPGSAGHGLNLQGACHHVCMYGLPWDLELYQQTRDRIWRQGQESDHVVLHCIVAEGTIDEAMVESIEEKGADQATVLAYLKEYTRRNHG